jgi:acetyl esterase/lipase
LDHVHSLAFRAGNLRFFLYFKGQAVMRLLVLISLLSAPAIARADDDTLLFPWPDLAPGETERATGTTLPMRPQDNPPISRVVDIRRPTIAVFPPSNDANGTAVLVLPGGGFGKVVPDMEGSEAAHWLGKLGITTFVLNYRTTPKEPVANEPNWKRPLQDAQRSMRWIRANASKWNLQTDKLGLLAFSAGGQVGSILITGDHSAYEAIDGVDQQTYRPDFAMLIYPWRIYDAKTDALLPEITVKKKTPPSFIVHTHDDASTSLGSVLLYAAMKRHDVPAELHVYENGGHGYGSRNRPNSNIGTWSERAVDWLKLRLR